jgi:hypothetical protein
MAVQPASPAFADAAGSFVRQWGHRKIRPSGSWPRRETRPQAVLGHCTIAVIAMSPFPRSWVGDRMIGIRDRKITMRNHNGIPFYLYNASHPFRKHRFPEDYDKSLFQTGAFGISHRASPQPKASSRCPPVNLLVPHLWRSRRSLVVMDHLS